jgi:hypothetical protein
MAPTAVASARPGTGTEVSAPLIADPALAENRKSFFLRLGPNGALGADERQWILFRLTVPKKPGREGDWVAVSYVRSTKTILVRCIRENGIEVSTEGKAALDALADNFDAWKGEGARGRGVLRWPPRP